jgi:hypothetical protein
MKQSFVRFLPVADQTSIPDTHVMKRPAHDQRPCPYQRFIDATTPGDTTPRIIDDRGKKSYQVWRPQPSISRTF